MSKPDTIRAAAALRTLQGATITEIETDLSDYGCLEVILTLTDGRHVHLSSCSCCNGLGIHMLSDTDLTDLRDACRLEKVRGGVQS